MVTAEVHSAAALRHSRQMESHRDRLPDFIAVGPPRTGTTWLHRMLGGHVGLPRAIKETQFFVWNYSLGLDWYRWYFRGAPRHLPVGEIAPTYFDHPEARERIRTAIPRCRIVISLRDPVTRVYSQYKAWHRAGLVEGPFDYAAQCDQLGASSSYAFNVREWRKVFGADNVLVTFYDDLRSSPQAYLDSICSFIGIARIDLRQARDADDPVNPSDTGPRSMRLARAAIRLRDALVRRRCARLASLLWDGTFLFRLCLSGGPAQLPLAPEIDADLRERLRPEIEDLEQLLGRDLSSWKLPVTRASGAISSRA